VYNTQNLFRDGQHLKQFPRLLLPEGAILATLAAQNDWPVYGHDRGGMRYCTLKQINGTS
jgi:hypothetical protein